MKKLSSFLNDEDKEPFETFIDLYWELKNSSFTPNNIQIGWFEFRDEITYGIFGDEQILYTVDIDQDGLRFDNDPIWRLYIVKYKKEKYGNYTMLEQYSWRILDLKIVQEYERQLKEKQNEKA